MSQRKGKGEGSAGDDEHFPFGSKPWSEAMRTSINDAVEGLRKSRLSSASDAATVPAVTPERVSVSVSAPDEPVSVGLGLEAAAVEFVLPKPPASEPPRWYGEGEAVEVEGYTLPGLVWIANRVGPSTRFYHVVIDTSLDVRKGKAGGDVLLPNGEVEVKAYRDLLPAGREMFLRWLAGGCMTHVPAHLVLLFMRGFEARLVDVGPDGLGRQERQAMLRFVRALVTRFQTLASDIAEMGHGLESVLTLADLPSKMYLSAPESFNGKWSWELVSQVCLSQAAYDEVRLPSVWALACLSKSSSLPDRSDDEFLHAFTLQYELDYPNGPSLLRLGGPMELAYLPVTRYNDINPGTTFMMTAQGTAKASLGDETVAHIERIVRRVIVDLAVYDRYVKTNAGSRGTPDAEVRLPLYLLVPRYRSKLEELRMPMVTPDELCVALWGVKLANRTSAPFLKGLHAALYFKGTPELATQEQVIAKAPVKKKPKAFKLDHGKIARLHNEDVHLTQLLEGVFSESHVEEAVSIPSVVATTVHGPIAALPGLDVEHTRLLSEVLEQGQWSRAEMAALANRHLLMLDGALEQLNEAAMELIGDFLLLDSGDVHLDAFVAQELRIRLAELD